MKDFAGRFRFAALTLASYDTEDFPDIFLGFVIVLAVAADHDVANKSPAHEFAKVGVGVSAAYGERLHYIVCSKWDRGYKQMGVDHGHCAIDSPLASERAPLGHVVLLDLFQFGHNRCKL